MIFQGIKKYQIKRVIFIALFWTIIDTLSTILNYNSSEDHSKSIFTRAILVFLRSACNELNQKFIVSKDFAEKSNLKPFQLEDLCMVELKGKANGIELFALKI